MGNLLQPIRSATQICVVIRRQCEISALVAQSLFGLETSGSFVSRHALRDLLHISRDTLLAVLENHVRPPC